MKLTGAAHVLPGYQAGIDSMDKWQKADVAATANRMWQELMSALDKRADVKLGQWNAVNWSFWSKDWDWFKKNMESKHLTGYVLSETNWIKSGPGTWDAALPGDIITNVIQNGHANSGYQSPYIITAYRHMATDINNALEALHLPQKTLPPRI